MINYLSGAFWKKNFFTKLKNILYFKKICAIIFSNNLGGSRFVCKKNSTDNNVDRSCRLVCCRLRR